eukprot:6191075-Pleurochrysis_carterae.AAC.2
MQARHESFTHPGFFRCPASHHLSPHTIYYLSPPGPAALKENSLTEALEEQRGALSLPSASRLVPYSIVNTLFEKSRQTLHPVILAPQSEVKKALSAVLSNSSERFFALKNNEGRVDPKGSESRVDIDFVSAERYSAPITGFNNERRPPLTAQSWK